MLSTELSLKFDQAVEPMFGSTIITADISISKLLSAIANTAEFYEVVKDANKEFDFDLEFSKAVVDDNLSTNFHLPINKKKIVALVTRLLHKFARKELSVVDFVMKYFSTGNYQKSYTDFLNNVIKPYSEAFLCCLSGGAVAYEEAISDEKAPVSGFSTVMEEDVRFHLNAIVDQAEGRSDLSVDAREELKTVIDGMNYILDSHNFVLLKVGFIALKNTVLLYRGDPHNISDIEKILLSYGVLG